MKRKTLKYCSITVFWVFVLLFVAKFAGPGILRLYVESGIGNCQKTPIFCMAPTEENNTPEINQEYAKELLPYKFSKMSIKIPAGFSVYQETVKKVYYKKMKRPHKEAVIYLLYEAPNFFVDLFPNVKKQGIRDNYEFIKRVMYAGLEDIEDMTDVFFMIMKGIFIQDLGDQTNVTMARFNLADKRGFINYNLDESDNYFDCNVINKQGDFFKIYIKDRGANLNLDKVLAIISTVDTNQ